MKKDFIVMQTMQDKIDEIKRYIAINGNASGHYDTSRIM